jgi:hypothetical protein
MSKQDDANLILKLYDLRREAIMREARSWFITFTPTSVQDFIDVLMGEHSAHLRMVVSYWDMAASLVNNGAIDEQMFNDANGEHLFVYAKVEPFLAELRTSAGTPAYLSQLEKLVKRSPDYEERMAALRTRMATIAQMRTARAKAAAASGQAGS